MGTYLSAVDLVTQNQLTIVARYGVNPTDRMLGDVSPGEVIISVNNSSTTARQVGPLVAAEFNVTKSLRLVDNMGGGQRFSSDQLLNFYSTPSSGYTTFNQQVGINFGTISLTSTNFSSQLFNTPGTYSWTVPAGVTSISVAGIGGGGGGAQKSAGGSGGGGGLITYSNSIAVTPGTTCTVVVGSGGATGGSYGINGGSTYLLLPGTNIPVVIAQGGAGGDSIFWISNSTSASYFDAAGIITTQTAYDPAGGTISYSVSSGSLPSGASLNNGTGAISWAAQSVAENVEYSPFTLSASNGSQTITKSFTLKVLKFTLVLDYLLVGGGGGAGYDVGGGGGGGGVIVGTSLPVVTGSSTVVTITIGSGGASNTDTTKQGNKGQATVAAFGGTTGTSVYSGVFNGTNQYLRIAGNTVFNFVATDWTVEAWVYLNALPTSDAWPTNWALHMLIATCGTPSVGDGVGFIIGQTKLIVQSNDTQYASTFVHGMAILTWNHVAYVRNGNNIYFYVNGESKGSVAFTVSVGTGSFTYIGSETGEGAYLNGYISNLRVVKGVAVYTGNFVVPTSNLSTTQLSGSNIAAITGSQTSLLTLQNATFIDNSSNAVSITNFNTAITTTTVIPILVVAFGGGGGGSHTASWNTTPLLYGSGLSGGSGGGGGTAGTNPGGASTQYSYSSFNGVGYGYAGGASFSGQWGSGGGGGAGGAGTAGTGGFVDGGAPYTSSINGTSVKYAGGGYGNSDGGAIYVTGYNSSNVLQGYYGYGANGTGSPNGSSYNGNPGIAIIRYPGSIPYGTGGTVTTASGYTIHTFTSNGTFSINFSSNLSTIQADYLIVGGGGGGGASTSYDAGAGGGAGGYRSFTGQSIIVGTSYTITVGAGGLGARNSGATDSQSGVASAAFGFTSAGGGRGGSDTGSQTGGDGGSGGGAGGSGGSSFGAGNTPSTTTSQGNNGGGGGSGSGGNQGAGGGGGAGAVGGTTSGGTSGSGGAGLQWLNSNYYAGGGGGGTSNYGGTAVGGTGGGGVGGTNGTLYTGGGGGGANHNYPTNTNIGGNGGGGVVIVRYSTSTQVIPTGGTISTASGYTYHTFTASGILLLVSVLPTVDYLVVGGGGGGGTGQDGGGGGAGGYLTGTGFAVSASTSYVVTVGAGAATTPANSARGGDTGSNSIFATLTALGGGGGGAGNTGTPLNGVAGGSGGGGGGARAGTGGAGTSGQGNAGATGSASPWGGGGGGAGAAATVQTGGIGNTSSITGTSTYYAGGGGGGSTGSRGLGGTGGGGDGGNSSTAGTAGTPNTGGGGGGGGDQSNATHPAGGAGGSGIVIIRYADTYSAASATTGSPTITVAGGYRVYTWTVSGSITF